AGRQRNQPYPVTGTAKMVGGAPAFLRIAAFAPCGVVAPVVEVQARIDAHPRGADGVAVGFPDAELAAQQAGAAGCVDEPARAMRLRCTVVLRAHHVRLTGFDRTHGDALNEFDAAPFHFAAQEILEGAAFDLPRWRRKHAADAEFRAVVE